MNRYNQNFISNSICPCLFPSQTNKCIPPTKTLPITAPKRVGTTPNVDLNTAPVAAPHNIFF